MNLLLQDPDLFDSYCKYQQKYNPKLAQHTLKSLANLDLFIELYGYFEGYRISEKKLIKSTSLKIFSYCLSCADCTMLEVASHIEYIFATLEEEARLDPKRAVDINILGEYKGMVLLDYGDNKNMILTDFGLFEMIEKSMQPIIKILKSQKQKDKICQLNNNLKLIETAFIGKLLS